jgi:hypothetical protein
MFFVLTCGHSAQAQEVLEREFTKPESVPISVEEDDLYTGSDVIPLTKELSVEESAQENSSDIDVIDDGDTPQDLACDDERLKKQVERFIYKHINKKTTNSVIEKRKRLLLVRNMADFTEINEDDERYKKNFNIAATVAYLKINQHRQIHKICRSEHNNATESLDDIYVAVYPFAGYYKITVANLVTVPEKYEDATFIFSW